MNIITALEATRAAIAAHTGPEPVLVSPRVWEVLEQELFVQSHFAVNLNGPRTLPIDGVQVGWEVSEQHLCLKYLGKD